MRNKHETLEIPSNAKSDQRLKTKVNIRKFSLTENDHGHDNIKSFEPTFLKKLVF